MKKSFLLLVSILISIAALSMPQYSSAHKVPQREYQRARILAAINTIRTEYNTAHAGTGETALALLGLDEDLNTMAQAHAVDTANAYSYETSSGSTETPTTHYLGHAGSDGSTLAGRMQTFDIGNIRTAAEVVAMRYNDPFHAADIGPSIDTMLTAIEAEMAPNDVNKRHYLLPYTHIGVGLELYRPSEDDPEGMITNNALFLVIVFAQYMDERTVIIPDPGTVTENNPTAPATVNATNDPYARFQYRLRLSTSMPLRGKGRKRVINRKPQSPGTGLGVIVEPESEQAQEFYRQQWKENAQQRRLVAPASSKNAMTPGEHAQMRRMMRMQQ